MTFRLCRCRVRQQVIRNPSGKEQEETENTEILCRDLCRHLCRVRQFWKKANGRQKEITIKIKIKIKIKRGRKMG